MGLYEKLNAAEHSSDPKFLKALHEVLLHYFGEDKLAPYMQKLGRIVEGMEKSGVVSYDSHYLGLDPLILYDDYCPDQECINLHVEIDPDTGNHCILVDAPDRVLLSLEEVEQVLEYLNKFVNVFGEGEQEKERA